MSAKFNSHHKHLHILKQIAKAVEEYEQLEQRLSEVELMLWKWCEDGRMVKWQVDDAYDRRLISFTQKNNMIDRIKRQKTI